MRNETEQYFYYSKCNIKRYGYKYFNWQVWTLVDDNVANKLYGIKILVWRVLFGRVKNIKHKLSIKLNITNLEETLKKISQELKA